MLITRRGLRVVHILTGAALAAVILVGAAAMTGRDDASADDAWMSMRGDGALTAAPCPSPSSIELSRASARRVLAAREGRFEVFGERPTQLEVPIEWDTDPLAAHRFRQNLHKLRFLRPLLWSYASSQSTDDLGQAAEIVVDWVRQNPRDGNGVPVEAWSDKVTGDRVPYLAYVVRAAACEGMLEARVRRALLASVAEHGRALASRKQFVPDNHGLFVDLGLLRLTNSFPFLGEAQAWRALARERFETTLRGRLSEGVWLEHSTGYQLLAIRAVEGFLAVHGPDPEISALLAEMEEAAAWFVKPNGEPTLFGDSNLEPVPDDILARAGELTGMRLFLDGGFGFVRAPGDAGDVGYLAVTDGFHNHTHKQGDELSFELFDHGTSVVSDSGLYDQDPGPIRDYIASSRAHSVLTVDQVDFPIAADGTTHGSGVLAAGEGDGWYAIEGKNPLVKPQGVTHRRLFLYRPGVALLIVDRVQAPAPHTYTRYLHLHPEVELDEAAEGEYEITAGELAGTIFDLDTGVEAASSKAKGQEDPPQGLTSPDFRELVPRWTIAYIDVATTESRVLSIALDESGLHAEDVDADPDGVTLTLIDAAGTSSPLTVTRDGETLTVAGE